MMVDTVSSDSELLDYAKNQHRNGFFDEANAIYSRILHKEPNHVEALRLRAVVCLEKGDTKNCLRILNDALAISPKNASIYNNFGSLFQFQEKYSTAIQHFEEALRLDSTCSPAANNLGNCLRIMGENQQAIEAYNLALQIDENLPQAWNNLGNALSHFQRNNEAESCFMKAISINPVYAEAWNNLGVCYINTDRKELALVAYNKALSYNKNFSQAYNNKGNFYLQNNRYHKALECFEQATLSNPNHTVAWNGYGCVYRKLGELKQAVKCFDKSIALEYDYAEAWNNLGLTYADQGLLESALNAFKTALKIRPDYISCHSNQLFYLNYLHDIHDRTLFEAHEHWAVAHQKYPTESKELCFSQKPFPLRLGFVSADFCRHPISYFILPIFRNLSSDKFQIYCYSNSPHEDDQTQKIMQHCKQWRNISNLTDQELVSVIREDKIDILFDLSGHTNGNRLTAFSLKPASLQVSWLGYPHTTGLDAIDVVLSDKISCPDYIHWMYTERVAYLPNSKYCYEAPDYTPQINELPAIANGYFTFASFNNPVKFNSKTFELWCEVLRCHKNSILVLSWKTLSDSTVAQRIYTTFKKHGIPPARIKLLGGTRSHQQVFKDYTAVDIALDTFPFTGGLTSCEAMWMGVPVPTMASRRPASRQTASILVELGLDALISFTRAQYLESVLALTCDIPNLQKLRQSIRPLMQDSTLSDGRKYTRGFEKVIQKLYLKKCEDSTRGITESPATISSLLEN